MAMISSESRPFTVRRFIFVLFLTGLGFQPGVATTPTFDLANMTMVLTSHDPIWTQSPGRWFDGAPLGNGNLGVVAWCEGNRLILTLDKNDLWEKRSAFQPDPSKYNWANYRRILAEKYANNSSFVKSSGRGTFSKAEIEAFTAHTPEEMRDFQRPRRKPIGTLELNEFEPPYFTRLPLGRLEIPFTGDIKSFSMRLRLGTAQLEGRIVTSEGSLTWSAYVHALRPLVIFNWAIEGALKAEPFIRFAVDEDSYAPQVRDQLRSWDYGPPKRVSENGINSVTESMPTGGEYDVSMRVIEDTASIAQRTLALVISHSPDSRTARAASREELAKLQSLQELKQSHEDWWRGYYPASFITIPDTRLEALYWLEMYRLAAGSRPEQLPIALEGPWTVDGGVMPRFAGSYYWNVNTQETYWPIYTANRLEFGESLYRMIDGMRPALRKFARDFFDVDGEFLRIGTDMHGNSTYMSPGVVVEFNGLPWVAHHYWLHYRYTLDKAFLRQRALPLMKAALAPYLAQLKPSPDGYLHLEFSASPEYSPPGTTRWGPDATIDLALIRALCGWLLEADAVLQTNDPERKLWKSVLDKLTPYPLDKDGGLAVRADLELTSSHRHHSHLMPIYPLKLINLETHRDLIGKSLARWKYHGTGEWVGWSFGWAASIAAHTARPQLARTILLDYVDHFVSTSGLHMDGVRDKSYMTIWEERNVLTVEAGFGVANALQDMLLQSQDGVIRIFPAAPWDSAAFWSLRAEGAFLVSGRRDAGLLEFAEIKSLQGGDCQVLLPDDGAGLQITVNGRSASPERQGRKLQFTTNPGDTIVISLPGVSRQIIPLRPVADELNYFGTKQTRLGAWMEAKPPAADPE